MEEREIQLLEGVANELVTLKALQDETPSSLAMYVDNKLD